MPDILKSVIQDLINDRTEQAQVSIHQYIVAKTQEIAGLSEAKAKVTAKATEKEGFDLLERFADKFDLEFHNWIDHFPEDADEDLANTLYVTLQDQSPNDMNATIIAAFQDGKFDIIAKDDSNVPITKEALAKVIETGNLPDGTPVKDVLDEL